MFENQIVEAVVRYYEGTLSSFGPTARGVDWKDEATQTKRFDQFSRALGLTERRDPFTLADFGCGYGALLQYLRDARAPVTYFGYDRSPRMLEAARAKYPDATFTDDWSLVPRVDYVVASGVFNVRLETPTDVWNEYVLGLLRNIDEKAAEGWAVNFLTGYADEHRKRAILHYADPLAMFDWCKRNASKWVTLIHDYGLHEFTIGVRRRYL
jgi:SAM-dependent methyltransferase